MSSSVKPPSVRVLLVQASPSTQESADLIGFLATNPTVAWLGAISVDPASIQSLSVSRPAVAVADLRAAGAVDTGQLLRQILAASQGTQIVALCDSGDEAGAQQAIAAGAAACLTRQSDPLAVLRAIHEVFRGRMHLSPTGQRAMRRMLDPAAAVTKPK